MAGRDADGGVQIKNIRHLDVHHLGIWMGHCRCWIDQLLPSKAIDFGNLLVLDTISFQFSDGMISSGTTGQQNQNRHSKGEPQPVLSARRAPVVGFS